MWDETKFENDEVTWGEFVEELILIQVHLTNPTKTTKVGALLSKDT